MPLDCTPTTTTEQWRLDLAVAADLIEREGHTKGMLCSRDVKEGPMCVMGAINRAIHGSADWVTGRAANLTSHRKFGEYLVAAGLTQRSATGLASSAVDWNNAEERTQEEVVSALRAAAAAA